MLVGGQLHAAATLPPEEEPLVPTEQGVGIPQGQCRCIRAEKNLQPLP